MPISLRTPIRRFSQNEFSELSFEVMRHVFAIHNELGRFFDERIYQQELAHRMPNVRLEEPVDVTFDSFHKRYFLDALVADGAVFEFKAVEAFTGWHRAQLIHYLMLCELGHGKLINVRPAKIEHEFVNTNLRHADRTAFGLETSRWNATSPVRASFAMACWRSWQTWGRAWRSHCTRRWSRISLAARPASKQTLPCC